MEFVAKVRRVGGSLIATIPKDLVKSESIQDGQLIKIIKIEKILKKLS